MPAIRERMFADVPAQSGWSSRPRVPFGVAAEQPETHNPRLHRDNSEGYPDTYITMGETAENVADRCGITREEMDRYALQSQQRAVHAQRSGHFGLEIVPVPLGDGRLVTDDDGPRPETTLETLASLRPVFRVDGRITAGNSCPLNDGAAALVIMSDQKTKALGIKPLARIVATGVSALEPEGWDRSRLRVRRSSEPA
jgi:acetyl-CoA C-acetyltransferase